MDGIAQDFKDKGVVFYTLYTREPHAGQKMGGYDFSNRRQTQSAAERADYAREMRQALHQQRPILLDTFGPGSVQQTLGAGRPNALAVIGRDGRLALWQEWSNPEALRAKLDEMTRAPAPKGADRTTSSSLAAQPAPSWGGGVPSK